MDPTIPTARICAMGEVIPAEKRRLDVRRCQWEKPLADDEMEVLGPAPCWQPEPWVTKFAEVRMMLMADGVIARLCTVAPEKPAAVVDWPEGGKSVSDLSTDATPEEVADSLRRQRRG